jgi:hypothetical protein
MLADLNLAIRMHIEFMLLGAVVGSLAIVAKLTGSRQRAWVERDLYVGDLRILSDIAFRRIAGPPFGSVERLCKRGLLMRTGRGPGRITLKGWIAILLRHTTARGRPA